MSDIKLSITERVMLANQFTILSNIDPQGGHYDRYVEILRAGYEGLYTEIFQSFSETVPAEVTSEVHEILTMYRLIDTSIKLLSPADQQSLDLKQIEFEGFDANEDPHYAIADFYISKKGLYRELKDFYLNSHSSGSLDKYRRMLPVYQQFKSKLLYRQPYGLTKDELSQLIDVA